MTTSAPAKPINLKWAGAGLGVFVGVGVAALSIFIFVLFSTMTATSPTAGNDSATLWIFSTLFCLVAIAPAAIVGALMGAVMGTYYQAQRQRLSAFGATGVGLVVGVIIVLLSYGVVSVLIGEQWASFVDDYGGSGLVQAAVPYMLLVQLGFIGLSHQLNRRLT